MLLCLDAAYGEASSACAGILAPDWTASEPLRDIVVRGGAPAPYEPGAFYKRELPLLLDVLHQLPVLPRFVLIDGFVWLDADRRPGLGARLHQALYGQAIVIGVAKSAFAGAEGVCVPVLRGRSDRPLFVSAAGMEAENAAPLVAQMHGADRIPTLIAFADRLARANVG